MNYILAQIEIAYLWVSFPGGRVGGRRVGEGVESRLTRHQQGCLAMSESIGRYANGQMDRRSYIKDESEWWIGEQMGWHGEGG